MLLNEINQNILFKSPSFIYSKHTPWQIKHFFSIGFALSTFETFELNVYAETVIRMMNYLKTRRLTFSQAKILNPIKSYCSHSTIFTSVWNYKLQNSTPTSILFRVLYVLILAAPKMLVTYLSIFGDIHLPVS